MADEHEHEAAVAKPVVLHSDMPSDVREVCFEKARLAMAKTKVDKDIAMEVKTAMEDHDGKLWHCVVGASFGASVAHEANCVVLFRFGKLHFLVFQSFDDSTLFAKKDGQEQHVIHVPKSKKKNEEEED